MTRPIAVIGTPGRVAHAWRRDTAAIFAETGHNTGNLAFQHATGLLFEDARFHCAFDFDPAELRERARLVCLPAANFLYAGFDLGDLARRLEATGLPLMVLGLGAQAMRSTAEVTLKPGTERLLRLFAERCATIVARGHHTAAVLERFGVANFEALGCPSNFINPDPQLGAAILRHWRATEGAARRIAFAPTFYAYNTASEAALHGALGQGCVEIVAQDPLPAVALARGERDKDVVAWLEAKAGFLSALPPDAQASAVARLRAHFDAEAWMEAYRRCDAVVGTRIHGVNLGWQAGRPALLVSYDLRTEELAEVMGLPLAKADALDAANPLEALRARIEACALGYDARRRSLAARLVAVLSAHGVTPAASLRALAETAPPAPAVQPAPRIWGFLEQYNRQRVAGWVASDRPEPPEIRVLFDGQEIGRTVPGRPRPDIGDKAWGFAVEVPPGALRRDVLRVEAVVAATGAQLANSPVVTSFAAGDARKVLRGRDGWLFLQNDTNAVLDQIQGRRALSPRELDAWAAFLRRMDAVATERGAPCVLLVAPNKECVFADRLPTGIELSEDRPVRRIEALARELALGATRILYPLERLRAEAPHPTYPRGDSHWTEFGAALALQEVEQALGLAPEASLKAEDYATEWRNCDLLSKLGGVCVEPQPVLRAPRRGAELVEDNGRLVTGRRRAWRSLAAEAKGSLLFAHDSFGEWLIPNLARRFRRTLTLWAPGPDAAALAASAPTAILVERAERFLIAPPAPP